MPRLSNQLLPKTKCAEVEDSGAQNKGISGSNRLSMPKIRSSSWRNRLRRLAGKRIQLPLGDSELIPNGCRRVITRVKPGWYVLQVDTETLSKDTNALGHTLSLSMGESDFELLLASTPVARRIIHLTRSVSYIDVYLEDGIDPAASVKITLTRLSKHQAVQRMLTRMTHHFDQISCKESISSVESQRTDILRRKCHRLRSSHLFALYHQAVQRSFTPTPYQSWLDEHNNTLARHWNLAPAKTSDSDHTAQILLQSSADLPTWQTCIENFGRVRAGFNSQHRLSTFSQINKLRDRNDPSLAPAVRSNNDYLIIAGAGVVPNSQFLTAIEQTLSRYPTSKLLFTDNDNINAIGEAWRPVVKPGWDPYLLESGNYIGPLFVCSPELYLQCDGLNPALDDAAFYDFLLRARPYLNRADVRHIPGILYSQSNRASLENSDRWFYKCDTDNELKQRYIEPWSLPEHLPSVDIIIPSRNQESLIRQCVNSILSKTDYPDFHITVIDNGSDESDVFKFYDSLSDDSRFTTLSHPGPFNYSAINNKAVAGTKGDILVLLNNDTQIIEPDWLSRMVSACHRPQIGCVGARLLYGNGRVQHAGVVLGMKGIAGHAHRYSKPGAPSYMHKLKTPHQVSAVTAACLAIRREVYEELGGLDERSLTVAFNDVDLCLRVHSAGYDNLLLSDVSVIHHESVSRGKDDSAGKAARFASECKTMRERWHREIHNDPYWNPLLSLVEEQPMLEAALLPVA